MSQVRKQLKNGKKLLIREALSDDSATILDYLDHVSRESDYLTFGPGEFDPDVVKEAAFIDSCYSSVNKLYLLGMLDNMVVAVLHFAGGGRLRTRHSGELSISVLKKYWDIGIGSALLDYLSEWANDNGIIKKINLRVRQDNQRAIKLFEKKGFKKEGILRKEIFTNNHYIDLYWMGLVLK